MSAFEFVAVLFSVIVGMAISHLLSAASELIEIHARVKTYWVNTLWFVTVFIWDIFSWWGMWALNDLEYWDYPSFFLVVVNLSGIYLMTTLVLPQPTESGKIDFRRYEAMKCASLLREAMWSMVQEIHSTLDFDFVDYTDKNLVLFHKALEQFNQNSEIYD